jgi:hypothetical protein
VAHVCDPSTLEVQEGGGQEDLNIEASLSYIMRYERGREREREREREKRNWPKQFCNLANTIISVP